MKSIYDEILLEHNLHPKHRGELKDGAVRKETFYNESCGDEITVYLKLRDSKIEDAKWQGRGCAISLASADLMAGAIIGKDLTKAKELCEKLDQLILGELKDTSEFGEAAALVTVGRMPARAACAKLAWRILKPALKP